MTENEATRSNGRGSPPPTRPRIGEATVKALNHPKRDTEKSTFQSRMRSKIVSTQRVTPSRRISPERKEKQTKPSFPSRTTPASTPAGVTPSQRLRYGRREPTVTCTSRGSWRAKDRKDGNEPCGQTHGGRTTTGQQVNIPKTHSTAADEARRRQPTVKEQRQARQERSHKMFRRSEG